MRAVVFAYHDVGVRCLQVLLARGVEVVLAVTHVDNPAETIWFGSVAALCAERGIACITPPDPSAPDVLAQVRAARPDMLFSFYYRHMLPVSLLEAAPMGAFNMHGSLLPKYRGRVPVNWAVLHGESETGATLHEMVAKPDAGAIVAQTAVPILPDDTAHDVFGKVVVAAEQTLWNVLPAMLAGQTPRLPNDLSTGSYFGGRNADDGRIEWSQPAQAVYNLIRAVAPPYPGAWTMLGRHRCIVTRARLPKDTTNETRLPDSMDATCIQRNQSTDLLAKQQSYPAPGLAVVDNRMLGLCGDGQAVAIHALLVDGQPASPPMLQAMLSHLQS